VGKWATYDKRQNQAFEGMGVRGKGEKIFKIPNENPIESLRPMKFQRPTSYNDLSFVGRFFCSSMDGLGVCSRRRAVRWLDW